MEDVIAEFKSRFGEPEYAVRAPGRINFLGGHTDYHEGFVLPAALQESIHLVFRVNDSRRMRVVSRTLGAKAEFGVGERPGPSEGWLRYVKGMTCLMEEAGWPVPGYDVVIGGDLPMGAGLSSSAALCCGLGAGMAAMCGKDPDRLALARIARHCESEFAGLNCGLLDQVAVLLSREDHALFLDCRNLEFRHIPLDLSGYQLVLIDSGVRRDLSDSRYNERRAEAEAGLRIIRESYPEVVTLRDATVEMLRELSGQMDPVILSRCAYVVAENSRVQRAAEYLEAARLADFGELMFETHVGLRDLYRVSCPELDYAAELSALFEGCLGARMVGGGFGGNLLAIVREETADAYIAGVLQYFEAHFGKKASARKVNPGRGLEIVKLGVGK